MRSSRLWKRLVRPGPSTSRSLRSGSVRSGGGKNHLALEDGRISRQSASIRFEDGGFYLEDLGQRRGLFLNGAKVIEPLPLRDGDVLTFGTAESINLVFRSGPKKESLTNLLSRLDQTSVADDTGDRDLRQLSLLLEATALLQAHMPFQEVLGAMVDRAITVTEADRGVLLEADSERQLRPLVARRRGGFNLPVNSVEASKTAIDHALAEHRGFIEQDVNLAEESVRQAASIVNQQLRSVIAIPLHSMARVHTLDSTSVSSGGSLLGVLYLDSRRPAAFSGLGRQILDALAIEAASVIDNARIVEIERQRRQMEQDLSIARDIQQRLLPKEFKKYPFFEVTGINDSCYSVGGGLFRSRRPGTGAHGVCHRGRSRQGIGGSSADGDDPGRFCRHELDAGSDPADHPLQPLHLAAFGTEPVCDGLYGVAGSTGSV